MIAVGFGSGFIREFDGLDLKVILATRPALYMCKPSLFLVFTETCFIYEMTKLQLKALKQLLTRIDLQF